MGPKNNKTVREIERRENAQRPLGHVSCKSAIKCACARFKLEQQLVIMSFRPVLKIFGNVIARLADRHVD